MTVAALSEMPQEMAEMQRGQEAVNQQQLGILQTQPERPTQVIENLAGQTAAAANQLLASQNDLHGQPGDA